MVDYKAIAAKAAKKTNHSVTKAATEFEYKVPSAGKAPARFIEYIELGVQPQRPYKGAEVPPKPMARFTFELLGNKNIREEDVNGQKVKFADRISLELPISMSEKASFKKLFDKLRNGRKIDHFGQMLNDAYILTVVHNVVGEGDKAKTYANINKGGDFYIESTKREELNEEGEAKLIEVSVKPAISDIKIFCFDEPTLDSWNSIEIKGTRKVKQPDGSEKEVSKNWLQERILKAVNYSGSPLEDLLLQAGATKDALAEEETQEEVAVVIPKKSKPSPVAVPPKPTKQESATAKTTKTASTAKSASRSKVTDSLAALGIN